MRFLLLEDVSVLQKDVNVWATNAGSLLGGC